MPKNQSRDIPFSTEKITKFLFFAKAYRENRERIIPQTNISANEGLSIVHEYGISFKQSIREKCSGPIISDIASWLFSENSGDDGNVANLLIFCEFLEIYLNEEERREFCAQITHSPHDVICEKHRKELLFQFGNQFGYPPP